MSEIIKTYEEKMIKSCDTLAADYVTIRAGRANPHILDKLKVDYYGTPTPVQQMAAVSVVEARNLVIQPWDLSQLKAIEKKIQKESAEYQAKLNKTSKRNWFTNDFMKSIHSISIEALFAKANIDISHIDNLTDDEIAELEKVIPSKFKSWEDFYKEAFKFNVKKFILDSQSNRR